MTTFILLVSAWTIAVCFINFRWPFTTGEPRYAKLTPVQVLTKGIPLFFLTFALTTVVGVIAGLHGAALASVVIGPVGVGYLAALAGNALYGRSLDSGRNGE